jgi:ribosomal protein S21
MNKNHKIWQSHVPGNVNAVSVVNIKQYDKNGNLRTIPDIGFALRFWKRALKDSEVLLEYKKRQAHIKKSDRRRIQLSEAKYLQRMQSINEE